MSASSGIARPRDSALRRWPSNTETAAELHITVQTVGKWRQRFIEKRLDGLLDEPRPGTPRKLSAADVDRVIGLTLESTPDECRTLVDAHAG